MSRGMRTGSGSFRSVRRAVAVAATAGTALIVSGTAYAFYTTNADGQGSASTANPGTQFTVTSDGIATGRLYPGAKVDLKLTLTNTGSHAIRVTNLIEALNVVPTAKTGANANACDAADLSIVGKTLSGSSYDLAVGASRSVTIANAVAMGTGAESDCQGVGFTLPVTLTGQFAG